MARALGRRHGHLLDAILTPLSPVVEHGMGHSIGPSGPSAVVFQEAVSEQHCFNPLISREERLLDQALQWGNFKSREKFLKASLVQLIQHDDMAF